MRDSAWPNSSGTLAADYDDKTTNCHQAADEVAVSRETHAHTCNISIAMKHYIIEALEDLSFGKSDFHVREVYFCS